MAGEEDISPLKPKKEKTRIQKFVETLLYCVREVDPIMMVALGSFTEIQGKRNETTAQAIKELLYYCTTYPNTTIRYKQSSMMIRAHSDESYHSNSQVRSRSGENLFFLGAYFNQKDNNVDILDISQMI